MLILFSLILFAQDDNWVHTIEAMEVLERKPVFSYELPEWVTEEYLFSLAGYKLDQGIESSIDEAMLFSELGGKPLSSSFLKLYSLLEQMMPDSALKLLKVESEKPLAPELRRQIFTYQITAHWLRNDPDAVSGSLVAFQADTGAAEGVDFDYLYDLVNYWETGFIRTEDSLLYFLFEERNPSKALKFLPKEPRLAVALRYHLDINNQIEPAGATGRFLKAHRLFQQGFTDQARDSLTAMFRMEFPLSPFVIYDLAQALLAEGDADNAFEVVGDSFPYEWLLQENDLELLRGRIEWTQGRFADAKKRFKEIEIAEPAYELYSRWITGKGNQQTEALFAKYGASYLYDVLPMVSLLRQISYTEALPAIEGLFHRLDISRGSPLGDFVTAVYVTAQNEAGNSEQTIGLSDVIRDRGAAVGEENYFIGLAHLAVGDAYYYKGEHFELRARPFYTYCTRSAFPDLRRKGYFSLAWSFLGKRDLVRADSIIALLRKESMPVQEREMLVFLEGLILYAKHDFNGAAGVFSQLSASSDSSRRMQGLYYRARSYEQGGQAKLASSAYDELLTQFPAAVEVRDAWPRLARAQIEAGSVADAEKTLKRLVNEARLYHFKFTDLYKDMLRLIYDASMASGDVEHAREIAERLSSTEGSTLILEAFYYQQGEEYTELWQVDDLVSTVNLLTEVNERSVYLPPLLLQLARMEIELTDYDSAAVRLERIMQWPEQKEVQALLPEVHYHRIRIAVLEQDWDKVISSGEIFALTYPEYEEYTARILLLRVIALVGRARNAKPFDRKKDINEAIEALDRLDSSYSDTEFYRENAEEIKYWRETAEAFSR
ncbi:tetratricopeptide repeat protein [candidate division WOR-3 bacterium]|nr:tetratricopeptide repeat protein [candidate division WOR-3 bacterium]